MEGERCIANIVCQAQHIEVSRWNDFRDFVREEIRLRRTNCNTAMKKQYLRECRKTESLSLARDTPHNGATVSTLSVALRYEKESEEAEELVPTVRAMLGLRKLSNANGFNQAYMYFCKNFLKCVVGLQAYKTLTRQGCSISNVATASDEAMALLLLENSSSRWNREFELKEERGEKVEIFEEDLPPTKYTSAGYNKQQKGFTKRNKGWKQAGIDRFNEILDAVTADRELNGKSFDVAFAQLMKTQKQKEDDDEEEPGTGTGNNWAEAKNELFVDYDRKKREEQRKELEKDDDDMDQDGGGPIMFEV